MSFQVKRQKVKVTNLMKASNTLNHDGRLNKAYRHFQDALYLRQTRNDMECTSYSLVQCVLTLW
jgi:hypothetical protein